MINLDHCITVGELKKLLTDVDDDRLVIISKDGEGNDFSPLAEATLGDYRYQPDTTWSGELVEAEDDPDNENPPCIVLWPTN